MTVVFLSGHTKLCSPVLLSDGIMGLWPWSTAPYLFAQPCTRELKGHRELFLTQDHTLLGDAEMCVWCFHEALLCSNHIHNRKGWCMILYGLILLILFYRIHIILYIMNNMYSVSIIILFSLFLFYYFLSYNVIYCANKIYFIIVYIYSS